MSASINPTGVLPAQAASDLTWDRFSSVRSRPAVGTYSAQRLLIATAAIVVVAFFASGHDFLVSRAVAYTQDAEQMELVASGGNAMRRLAFFALGGWGLALLISSRRKLSIDLPLGASLTVLLALATCSFLWADDPGMCLRRLIVLFCSLIAAVGIARAFSLREICLLTISVVATFAVMGLLAEVALGTFRPWGSDYRFAGTVHPNTQGPALAAMCFAALGLIKDSGRYRPLLWAIIGAGFVLLLLTKSRAATAGFLAAVAAVQLLRLPLSTKFVGTMAGVWMVSVAAWMLWVCGIDPVNDFRDAFLLGRAEEADTLSGRAFIWPEVMRFIEQRFWLGYGYEAFWTPWRIENISDELGWGLREAHNGYLELWLWLGAVGLAAMLAVVVAAMAAAVRNYRATGDAVHMLPLALLVFGLINAIFESGMVVMTLVPFLLVCGVARHALFCEREVSLVGTKLGPGEPREDSAIAIPGSRFAPG